MTTKELLIREIKKLPEPVLRNFYDLLIFIKHSSEKKLKHSDKGRLNKMMQEETDYLLKSPVNKKKLLTAIENVKHRRGLVEIKI